MKKYLTLLALSIQKQLEVRIDFVFEQARSLSLLISMYFLWTALMANRSEVLGYDKVQLITYVLMMTVLRAVVLAAITDRIPQEIAKGEISDILLRPLSHIKYWAMQDAASKILNISAVSVTLPLFIWLVSAPFFVPSDPSQWMAFGLATFGGMVLYFQMSYLLGVMGFWTSQTWGPRFCFEVVLEFCGGAYFPIDFLPVMFQKIISVLPFPYLVFYPLSIYLGRLQMEEIVKALLIQWIWIGMLAGLIRFMWSRGLRHYAAEGR